MSVTLENNILHIYQGDGYYDVNVRFEADRIKKLIEEVGVKGGHVGWTLKYYDPTKDYTHYDEPLSNHDFGRKVRWLMDEVKELIKTKKIKAKIITFKDRPQKCY